MTLPVNQEDKSCWGAQREKSSPEHRWELGSDSSADSHRNPLMTAKANHHSGHGGRDVALEGPEEDDDTRLSRHSSSSSTSSAQESAAESLADVRQRDTMEEFYSRRSILHTNIIASRVNDLVGGGWRVTVNGKGRNTTGKRAAERRERSLHAHRGEDKTKEIDLSYLRISANSMSDDESSEPSSDDDKFPQTSLGWPAYYRNNKRYFAKVFSKKNLLEARKSQQVGNIYM